jgi:FAD/FMN-containing dehydrogenase
VLRRDFVRNVAAITVGLACGEDPPRARPRPTERPEQPIEPSPQVPAPIEPAPPPEVVPATDADWAAFGRSLRGRLVRPSDAAYGSAKQLYDPTYDAIRPAGIVFAADESDVQRSIAFARSHGVLFTARSGGHSYGGYSTCEGLVCDVGGLSRVDIDTRARSVNVGSGVKLIDLYAGTAPHNLAIPGGTCASVGIAGLALGGGQGVLGRKLGLTCDAVLGVRIVNAAGEIVVCDQDHDLTWASRGSGGGNFGVVTSFTFRARPIGDLARFGMSFPWEAAGDVLAAWQEWAPNATDALWSALHLTTAGTGRYIRIGGVYAGPEAELRRELTAFIARAARPTRAPSVTVASYFDTMRAQARCSDRTIEECHLPTVHPSGQLGRRSRYGFSDIYDRPLTSAGISEILRAIEARGDDPAIVRGAGGVSLDALGGAINRLAPEETAFVHRRALFISQCTTHWPPRAEEPEIAANRAWLALLRRTMRPLTSGHSYVNYIDPELGDWERAYYGVNLDRLRAIKARHDPDDFFRFAQSIRASA